LFERFVPGQRDDRGGQDNFEEESHPFSLLDFPRTGNPIFRSV
jgi:hypothetical protein